MNQRIKELSKEAGSVADATYAKAPDAIWLREYNKKFAELLVEELRNVVVEVYRKTPLELCGPLLTADEKIAKHFGAY